MAFNGPHWLLSFGGGLPGGESWSTNLRLQSPWNLTFEQQDALVDDYHTVIENWFATAGSMSSRANLAWTKLNYIGVDGRYIFNQTSRYDNVPVTTGPQSTPHYPNQVALVVTLLTGVARGYANRGRIFLPIPALPLSTDGRLTTAVQDQVNTSMKTLLDNINLVVPLSRVVICSNVGAGEERLVTSVGVGRVLDTMRSRRTSLMEERTAVDLTPVP